MRTALGVSVATVADDDGSPVPDELIGRLYRSPRHGINELVSGLSTSRRGSLAAFCYSRAHLHDIGLAIAATCDLETLVTAGGRAGNFLFDELAFVSLARLRANNFHGAARAGRYRKLEAVQLYNRSDQARTRTRM